jgi:hypothetical protein
MRFLLLLLVCLLSLVNHGNAAEKVTSDEMKQLGKAYHAFLDKDRGRVAPTKSADLKPFLTDPNTGEKLIEALKKEEIIFLYNVRIVEMIMGTVHTVVAYPKDAAENGGPVLYADGTVRTLTADEFKKATLAKSVKQK